jgi:hypothetical protein
MNTPERWIAHYERLLCGSLSRQQRQQAEAELRFWKAQAQRQAA